MLSHFDAIVEAAERDRQTNGFGRPSSIAHMSNADARQKNRKRTYNIENSFCSENIKHQYT